MADSYISLVTLPDNLTYDLKDAGAARSSHTHGNISSTGTLSVSSTIAKNDALVIATTANSGKITKTSITFDGSTTSAVLSKKGTWENMYTHPTGAGNNHLPSGGSSGQFLAWNTDSTGQWVNNPNTDTKVNVKLATTSKAYLLGITTTPTSTTSALEAISDTGVYLGTTAGYIHATKFVGDLQGTASKATGDEDGNLIKTTYLKLSGGTVTGSTTFSGGVTFSNKGFYYTGIESATTNSNRCVWFADSSYVSKPVYNNNFKYNPASAKLIINVATLESLTTTTANTAAWSILTLGNNANVSSSNAHSEGKIVLYSAATLAHTIVGASTTAAYEHTLPNSNGTLLDSENYTDYLDSSYAIEILQL